MSLAAWALTAVIILGAIAVAGYLAGAAFAYFMIWTVRLVA